MVETFKGSGVRKVITNCPHCFNTFRNEYPQFGGEFEVVHHTQFLADLVDAGKLMPNDGPRPDDHLPRLLLPGPPQRRLRGAARAHRVRYPASKFVEMPRNSRQSFCCGAGGGHMFVDESKGRRINHVRAEEAQSTGAGVVATNCPFCVQMFEDGVAAVESGRDQARPADGPCGDSGADRAGRAS